MTRGQTNLLALAVALLAVTAVGVVGFGAADRAYLDADRPTDARRTAIALSERLVGPGTPVTARPNVLDADELGDLNATRLRTLFPVVEGYDARVRLDDRRVAATGDATGGTTVRRVVLVENRTPVSLTPDLSATEPAVTLPRRSPRVRLDVRPPEGTDVTVVRADDRVVLRNASGLAGSFDVRLSRFETTTLAFEADGPLPTGSVEVTYYPAETRKAVLGVTVDA